LHYELTNSLLIVVVGQRNYLKVFDACHSDPGLKVVNISIRLGTPLWRVIAERSDLATTGIAQKRV
jgi:hypothetical protein